MVFDIVSLVAGLIAGLLTGFIFERRATRSAELQNEGLRRELGVLKATIYSLGGAVEPLREPDPSADLTGVVARRAVATQGPSGRVVRPALVAHFLQSGHDVADVEAAISSLVESGAIKEDGHWLHVM